MPKSSISYLACIFLIFIALTISAPLLMWFKTSGIRLYTITPFYLVQLGLFIFVGMILGFCDSFIYEMKKSGIWAIDVRKISILGIPIGVVACSHLIYFSIHIPGIIHNIFANVVNVESGQVVAAQIILGYVLITSFYKKTAN